MLATLEPGEVTAAQSSAVPASDDQADAADTEVLAGPAVRQLLAEHKLDPTSISGSGKGGRIIKEDVLKVVATKVAKQAAAVPSNLVMPASIRRPVSGLKNGSP